MSLAIHMTDFDYTHIVQLQQYFLKICFFQILETIATQDNHLYVCKCKLCHEILEAFSCSQILYGLRVSIRRGNVTWSPYKRRLNDESYFISNEQTQNESE